MLEVSEEHPLSFESEVDELSPEQDESLESEVDELSPEQDESLESAPRPSLVGQVGSLAMTFLRFLNHYPSHIWIFALIGRLDAFYWMYVALNLLYLARGWLGLALRFGRF